MTCRRLFLTTWLVSLASLTLFITETPAQWMPNFRVTNDPAPSRTEVDGGRNVIVDEGVLMTVWSDLRDGNFEIYFREQLAGTWTAPVRLTTNLAVSIHPAIGYIPGEVRVVWEDHRMGHAEIWTKRRTLGVWSPDSCVTGDEFESARPSLDHTGGHLVWEETKDGNREIYYRKRLANGSWEPEFRVSTDTAESAHPSVASPHATPSPPFEESALIAWQDERDGNWEIYSRFTSNFVGWGPEMRVSDDPGQSRFPSVAAEEVACGDVVFTTTLVAWQDDRHGNEEIYAAEGGNGFWSLRYRATTSSTPSQHPSVGPVYRWITTPFGVGLCASPGIVWEERSASGTSGSIEFLDTSMAPSPVTITDVGANATNPSIAVFGSSPSPGVIAQRLDVVWTDRRHGNDEIYLAETDLEIIGTSVPVVVPADHSLLVSAAQPNPFRGSASFSVEIAREGALSVRVLDASGRFVRALFRGNRTRGAHEFTWDGRDDSGRRAASGTYFVVVEGEDRRVARRIVLLR